jgi:methylglutaconyl-CoA hydratase
MKYKTLEIQIENDVATVHLNRPDVHNAMNEELMRELTDFFKKIANENGTRIIILTGKGKSFCAGADLNWMKSMAKYDKKENIKDSRLLSNLFESIYNCPKPVIAKVNGHAFGGGLGLFAVCDIAIAVPDCKFAFSEVKLGIIPSVISTYVNRRISIANMRRLFLTGERFNSEYACNIGLIDFVCKEDEIDKKIEKYIKIFSSSGPNAIKEIKNLVDCCENMNRKDYIEHTIEKIAELRVSEEGQEGINAFLEKRKSKWSG